MRARITLAALLAAAGCLVCLVTVSGAGAQPGPAPTPAALASQAGALADAVAAQWQQHELASGALVDPVIGPLRGDYGDAMIGQAMVVAGSADGDEQLISDGIAAELADAAHPDGGGFELLGLSGAYSANQQALAQDPAWLAARPRIARFLHRHRASISDLGACYTNPHCYTNLKLVSAIADLSLLGTGLRSGQKGELLTKRHALRKHALALLAMADENAGQDAYRIGNPGLSGIGILSDPSENPLAYHALSTVMLGRALLLLGPNASSATLGAFDRTAKALVGLLAPDGDATYIGRGQGQVWTVGVTVDALAIAAELTGNATWRGRYLAAAQVALNRLQSVYPSSGWGLPLVPRFATIGGPHSYAGIDHYADTVEYNGLALWALDDAAAALAKAQPAPAESLPSTTGGAFVDPSHTQFAAVTHGGLWFAVHALDSNLDDPRYGFGLVAAELNDPAGWQAVLPAAPLTNQPVVGSLALRGSKGPLHPVGSRISVSGAGVVTIRGGWVAAGATKLLGRGTVWTYSPTPANDGVSVSCSARRPAQPTSSAPLASPRRPPHHRRQRPHDRGARRNDPDLHDQRHSAPHSRSDSELGVRGEHEKPRAAGQSEVRHAPLHDDLRDRDREQDDELAPAARRARAAPPGSSGASGLSGPSGASGLVPSTARAVPSVAARSSRGRRASSRVRRAAPRPAAPRASARGG